MIPQPPVQASPPADAEIDSLCPVEENPAPDPVEPDFASGSLSEWFPPIPPKSETDDERPTTMESTASLRRLVEPKPGIADTVDDPADREPHMDEWSPPRSGSRRRSTVRVEAEPDRRARTGIAHVFHGRSVRDQLPVVVVLSAAVWFIFTFSVLVVRRHNEFGSFDYDLGIYDQGIWLAGRGRQLLTVRGLRYFGHHWNPATIIYIPAYWLGAGPNLLNVSQVVVLAAGAVPVHLGAKKVSGSSWIGVILALAYLGHPSTGWLANELFHPDAMAIPFVLAAWAFAEYERWRWYTAAVIIALLWKEDIALAIAFLGLVVVWRKHRRYGIYTFLAATAYFLLATKLIIPSILGRAAFYEGFFGPLGATTSELAKNAVIHPDLYFRVLREHQAETYGHSVLRPFGYIALLSPSYLLIGAPQFLINILSSMNFVWNPRYHYVSMPLASATIATVKSVGSRAKRSAKWGLAILVVLFCFGVRNQGVAPWSNKFDDGYWPTRQATSPLYEAALTYVPDDPSAVTSSPYFLTPHLTHRYEAYTFPNPWKPFNWGVNGENPRTGDRVDYVVMNESILGADDLVIYNAVVVQSGEFAEVYRSGVVVVWKRVRPHASTSP